VTAPVSFQSVGNKGTFDGIFTIKRLDYAIGEGIWTDIDTVANEIQIKFHLVVTAAPSKK
jgi:polyisoprenoid-binding protein YceI